MGAQITPIAFLVIKGESVRMLPIAAPASTTADRVVEQLPDLVDKLYAMIHPQVRRCRINFNDRGKLPPVMI